MAIGAGVGNGGGTGHIIYSAIFGVRIRVDMKRRQRPINKQRRSQAQAMGKRMKASGVKVGRKPISVNQVANLDNYRSVMRGMGKRLARVDVRRLPKH